jgi:hypothetical protein
MIGICSTPPLTAPCLPFPTAAGRVCILKHILKRSWAPATSGIVGAASPAGVEQRPVYETAGQAWGLWGFQSRASSYDELVFNKSRLRNQAQLGRYGTKAAIWGTDVLESL